MDNSKRLTVKNRVNGEVGYYSMCRKDELASKLGHYEDIIDTPDELLATLQSYDEILKILICAISNAVNNPDDVDARAKLLELVILYNEKFGRTEAPNAPAEPPSAI